MDTQQANIAWKQIPMMSKASVVPAVVITFKAIKAGTTSKAAKKLAEDRAIQEVRRALFAWTYS